MQNPLIFSQRVAPHIRTGRTGERIAVQFLERLHYRILGRNVRLGKGEIDILAWDPEDNVLIFAEVKTRLHDDPDYRPELNLTSEKRRRMVRAARLWVAEHEWDGGYRLDVLCVTGHSVVEHYKEVEWESRGRFRR